MLVEISNIVYWRFTIWLNKIQIRTFLMWNRIFNPLRYATLLYAFYMIVGMNPQDQEKCENALIRLPFGTRRHVHDLCVKALIPDASEELSEGLFSYYLMSAPAANEGGSDIDNQDIKTLYDMSPDIFFRNLATIGNHVRKSLKAIPYEYGRAMTRKQWREFEKYFPSLDALSQRIKERHPEYPPEFWIPFDQALEQEKKRKHFTKIFHK